MLLMTVSFPAAHAEDYSARGLVDDELRARSLPQSALAGLFLLPRYVTDGTLYGMERTAAYVSNPDFVRKVKDILYIIEPDLMWYPVVDYASGFRPTYGAGLRYKKGPFDFKVSGNAYDSELWSLGFESKYRFYTSGGMLVFKLGGLLEHKDDLRFSGFGGDPKNDPRNAFFSDEDQGTFSQDKRKIEWRLSYEHAGALNLHYSGLIQRRSFKPFGDDDDDLREVFELSLIPGLTAGTPVSETYHELAVEVDTRQNRELVTPGFRTEVYSGISAGLGENESNTLRVGADVSGYIKTFHKDRLLIPRLSVDIVEDLNDEPIPFSNYPRQQIFRGVSSREWIRMDEVSTVLSLEYQWRISPIFSAHVFYDYLAVGKTLSSIQWDDGPWAVGAGLDFHYRSKEWARVELAAGSEGFQAKLSIGMPVRSNARTDW